MPGAQLDAGLDLALADVEPEGPVHGQGHGGVLVDDAGEVLTGEGADGADGADDALVEQTLEGHLDLAPGDVGVAVDVAADGEHGGHVQAHDGGEEAEVGGDHALGGSEVEHPLVVELLLAGQVLLEDGGVPQDVLQLLAAGLDQADEQGGVLEHVHEEVGLGGAVLADLQPELVDGLAPLAGNLALQLLEGHGVGAAEGVVQGGEHLAQVQAELVGGVAELLSLEDGQPAVDLGGDDGVGGADEAGHALIADVHLLEEVVGVDGGAAGQVAAGLLDQGVDQADPPNEGGPARLEVLHAGLEGDGVEGGVDGPQQLGVLLGPGQADDLLQLGHVGLQVHHDVEGGDPDLGVLGLVGEDGRDDGEDTLGVLVAGPHEVVDGDVARQADAGLGHLAAVQEGRVLLDDGQEDGQHLLVGEAAEGGDGDELVLRDGDAAAAGAGAADLALQVGDPLLGDDAALLVAHAAHQGLGVAILGLALQAGLLQQVAEGQHGGAVDELVAPDGLALDQLEDLLEEGLSGHEDGAGQVEEDGGDLALGQLVALDQVLEELDALGGAAHDDGVDEDVLGDHVLLAALAPHDVLVQLHQHGPVEELEDLGENQHLHGDVLVGQAVDVEQVGVDDLLDELLGLADELLLADVLAVLGHQAAEPDLLEVLLVVLLVQVGHKGLVDLGVGALGGGDVGLDGGPADQLEDLAGAGEHLLGLDVDGLGVELALVDDGLDEEAVGRAADVVAGDGGAGPGAAAAAAAVPVEVALGAGDVLAGPAAVAVVVVHGGLHALVQVAHLDDLVQLALALTVALGAELGVRDQLLGGLLGAVGQGLGDLVHLVLGLADAVGGGLVGGPGLGNAGVDLNMKFI